MTETTTKPVTEIDVLKAKKKAGKATAEDLTRLKVLIDGEPLSKDDLAAAKKREDDRITTDKAEFEAKHNTATMTQEAPGGVANVNPEPVVTLDQPAEHPRIVALRTALLPFTQIEAHSSRPNEYVLFTRGISITAGDVRAAREAMKA